MSGGFTDPFEDLTPEQRQTVADNIVMGEAVLDTLIQGVLLHLFQTRNLCPLACIGEGSEAIDAFTHGQVKILLVQALRRLAAIEWEKAQ